MDRDPCEGLVEVTENSCYTEESEFLGGEEEEEEDYTEGVQP
jgi:hypothetical protein